MDTLIIVMVMLGVGLCWMSDFRHLPADRKRNVTADLPFRKELPAEDLSEDRSNDALHLHQIATAQVFLNENPHADLSRVKCLLRAMLPARFHKAVDMLRQHQDPKVIIHITGGQNIVAPHAKHIVQETAGKKPAG